MNKSILALIFLSFISIDVKSMHKRLHAKYPHQEQSDKSPKSKEYNDFMAREEMMYNMSACMCQYRAKKLNICTTCPESKTNKARELVVMYYV